MSGMWNEARLKQRPSSWKSGRTGLHPSVRRAVRIPYTVRALVRIQDIRAEVRFPSFHVFVFASHCKQMEKWKFGFGFKDGTHVAITRLGTFPVTWCLSLVSGQKICRSQVGCLLMLSGQDHDVEPLSLEDSICKGDPLFR
ncbi:hypothetical protein [Aquitalea pelogenes]|uniref:hypothetical protein n=1 Tax=Aquitalea pelogenes TaxID=1293573 RepID=UPI0035B1C0C2